MRRRVLAAAGAAVLATVLAACSPTDDSSTNDVGTSSSSAIQSPPVKSEPEATVPSKDDTELIASAKACTVVTKAMLEAVIPDSTFVSMGDVGPSPADPTHEQRCGYKGRVGGQYNDNPNTPGSEFTLQVVTFIDDASANGWSGLKALAVDSDSEGSDEVILLELGVAGRKSDGSVVVEIDSVDDTDGVVSTEQYVNVMLSALKGLAVR